MNKIRVAIACLFAVFEFTYAYPAFAQVATGTPPFGTYGGGPDVINLGNLNVHLSIPVLNKAGRGIPFTYNLIYDTAVWTPVTSGSTATWQPATNWGWGATTQVATGILTASVIDTSPCYCTHNGNPYLCGHAYTWGNWAYLDPGGVSHPFAGTTNTESTTACGASNPTINVMSTDGSGYTLVAQGSSGTVYGRNGNVVLPQTNVGNGSSTKTDANGNQISVSSTGVFTDTLGTTVLTVSGIAPNPMKLTYTPPAGGSVFYQVIYTPVTVKTAFGCSSVSDVTISNAPLVTEIDLPDISVNPSDKYVFTYEETIPGNNSSYTGRLASVTLPTGGTISYSYSGGDKGTGIWCNDGSAATLTRTITPGGQWTYQHSEIGTAWTTLVTDPQGNQTNLQFQGIFETERQVYSGLTTSGTLLQTLLTCYNNITSNCNTTPLVLPIFQTATTTQWPGTNGKQSKVFTSFNSFGLPTETDEYDYGNGGPPSSPIRKTLVSYATLGNNIADRRTTITVQDGSGVTKAQTTLCYDEGTPSGTTTCAAAGAPTATSPAPPQHIAVTGSRGNVTTIATLVQGSTTIGKKITYFDTGNVQTATDVNGASTTYTYGTGSCGSSFPTSVSEPMNLSSSFTWDCTGALMTSATDENNKVTSIAYTPDADFWRVNSVTDPASNILKFSYTGANQVEISVVFNNKASTVDALLTSDGLGRTHISQLREGPSSSTFDSTEVDYDTVGRPTRTTLAYAAGAGASCTGSCPATSTTYDALGRVVKVTDSGGLSEILTPSQNDVNLVIGPKPTGENTKNKQFEYDGLGRLTSVCEITSATGSGTCGQSTPATGYWTKYTYDVLGDLTNVTQNAQSTSTQTRSFAYDGLGRMTSETVPEIGITGNGTASYVYDTDSTCGVTSNGDMIKKVDAAGNAICSTYDAMHRVTGTFVASGTYASVTPYRYFVYDSATVNGIAMSTVKARIAEAYTSASPCPPPCSSKLTDLGFSYDALGNSTDVYQSSPHSGGYYHVTASYFPNGVVNQLSNLIGLPTITYNVDGEGRTYSATASSGQNPLTSTTYNTASLPLVITLGSGDNTTYTYDPNTNRMHTYSFNVNGQSETGTLTWNAIGTLESLAIVDPFNSADNQTCNYTHDDLVRINTANCGTPWSQSFSYSADTTGAFGNLAKSGSASFQPTYSYQTNRMTQIGSSTPTYDSNGNVLNDYLNNYSWDAYGRPITVDGVAVTYDALGRIAEENNSKQFVYAPTGQEFAIMNGQALVKAYMQLPASDVAAYNSAGLANYHHSDWLGSFRLSSTTTRSVSSSFAYAPFGETYAVTGTDVPSFTGMTADTHSNVYDFPAREYGIQGRWPSPDPAGLAAAHLTDPQTLNRYAYVRNSPLHLIDPFGTDCEYPTQDQPCGIGDGLGGCMICGDPPNQPWPIDGGPGGGGGGGGFLPGPAGPPIGLPGQQPIGTTPSTFPTGPGIDWTNILFGPPDPSQLIFNFCVNGSGNKVDCSTEGAIDCSNPDNANVTGCSTAGQRGVCLGCDQLAPFKAVSDALKSLGQAAKKEALSLGCGSSVDNKVLTSMRNGALTGATKGAFAGFAGGELAGGLAGIPGAALGAFTGATVGATGGVFTGSFTAAVCNAVGAYK